jgi:histone acetyltransferase (RNA polymerase elongator complex component)
MPGGLSHNFDNPRGHQKPFIVPVFIPHQGCPHRCVFCDQAGITGATTPQWQPTELNQHIARFLDYCGGDRYEKQIAFYGGNFLGLPPERITQYLAVAENWVQRAKVASIRFSTRPDTITRNRLRLIKGFSVRTIEIGIQSMADRVLSLCRRGHDAQASIDAIGRLKSESMLTGGQIMVGLPGDSEAALHDTTQRLIELKIDFVRIYPTLVLANSPLADWYHRGRYVPLPLTTAVTLTARQLEQFHRWGIPVIRMGLQASVDLANRATTLAGPYHPAFGELVYQSLFLRTAQRLIQQTGDLDNAAIHVHPQNFSKMRGIRNENTFKLTQAFELKGLSVLPDPLLALDQVRVGARVESIY